MTEEKDTLISGSNNQDTDATQIEGGEKTIVQVDAVQPPRIPDMEIKRELGRGGMGVVYEGRQGYLDRRVAIKVLLSQYTRGSSQFSDRFQREAKILAQLNHPHIVACYQAGVAEDGNCFLVMEFIEGSDLECWIKQHGALDVHQALGVVKTIAQALRYAHENGIIHRDIKPENILLGKDAFADLPFTPKLVDLGLARPDASANMQLTAQGVIMGTPATMAPEQFDDPDNVDLRADIYGLGCVLYYAVCAQPAFCGQGLTQLMESKLHTEPPNPRDINPAIPQSVVDLIKDMLAKKADDRIGDYDILLSRIDGMSDAKQTVFTARVAPSAVKKPGPPLIPVIAVLAVIIAVVLYVLNNEPVVENNQPPIKTSENIETPVLYEQLLIQKGAQLSAWWTVDSGIWGHEEEGSGISGFAREGEVARLVLAVDQPIQALSGVIGGNVDEGNSAAFGALEIHMYFDDGSQWRATVNDFGFETISLLLQAPKNSQANDTPTSLVPPRQWPWSVVKEKAGWVLRLASIKQELVHYQHAITRIEFSVKDGNCFLRDLLLNKQE